MFLLHIKHLLKDEYSSLGNMFNLQLTLPAKDTGYLTL